MKKLVVCAIMSLLLHSPRVVAFKEVPSSSTPKESSASATDFVIKNIVTPRSYPSYHVNNGYINDYTVSYKMSYTSAVGFVMIDMIIHYFTPDILGRVLDFEPKGDQFTHYTIASCTDPVGIVYNYTSNIPVAIFSKKLAENFTMSNRMSTSMDTSIQAIKLLLITR
jgi:hypothetical protein